MNPIAEALMRATRTQEVTDIINSNLEAFEREPRLWRAANLAKIRIVRLRREKMKSYNFMLN
jgi:hypothetical protein